jgi:hypothetical protein
MPAFGLRPLDLDQGRPSRFRSRVDACAYFGPEGRRSANVPKNRHRHAIDAATSQGGSADAKPGEPDDVVFVPDVPVTGVVPVPAPPPIDNGICVLLAGSIVGARVLVRCRMRLPASAKAPAIAIHGSNVIPVCARKPRIRSTANVSEPPSAAAGTHVSVAGSQGTTSGGASRAAVAPWVVGDARRAVAADRSRAAVADPLVVQAALASTEFTGPFTANPSTGCPAASEPLVSDPVTDVAPEAAETDPVAPEAVLALEAMFETLLVAPETDPVAAEAVLETLPVAPETVPMAAEAVFETLPVAPEMVPVAPEAVFETALPEVFETVPRAPEASRERVPMAPEAAFATVPMTPEAAVLATVPMAPEAV